MTSRERLTAFVVVIVIVGAGAWAWIIDRRTEAIASIAESASRIEQVATNTEQLLRDSVTERQTPESVAERAAVRQAVREIAVIKELLCQLPDLADSSQCP